jgi:hypothetical protein
VSSLLFLLILTVTVEEEVATPARTEFAPEPDHTAALAEGCATDRTRLQRVAFSNLLTAAGAKLNGVLLGRRHGDQYTSPPPTCSIQPTS